MTRSELKLFLVEAELRKLLCKVYFRMTALMST